MSGPAREPAPSGRRSRRPTPLAAAGFTLIELLVVLMIAAVIVGMVTVSGTPSPERALRYDAERLALLLSLAREEAQLRGAPIRFETDDEGYRFVIFRERQWRPIGDDADLRPRPWPGATQVTIERADGTTALEFGRDLVEPPYRVRLARAGAAVTIDANGLGRFEVRD